MHLGQGKRVDELRAATQIDLGYLADEVVQLDEADGAPAYADGLAAYEHARDALDAASEPEEFVGITRSIRAGRLAMAHVRARLAHEAPPTPGQLCFFDPGHGAATQLISWTPDGLEPRIVPVCAEDGATVQAGSEPDPRLVGCDGAAVPFWRAQPHFAFWFQGYFGAGDGCVPFDMLAGFPLADRFAEPDADPLPR